MFLDNFFRIKIEPFLELFGVGIWMGRVGWEGWKEGWWVGIVNIYGVIRKGPSRLGIEGR